MLCQNPGVMENEAIDTGSAEAAKSATAARTPTPKWAGNDERRRFHLPVCKKSATMPVSRNPQANRIGS